MALVFDNTPSQDSVWSQAGPRGGHHATTIRVTGFVSTNYYDMIVELYNDPGLPQFASTPDPSIFNIRLDKWEILDVQCGVPTPGITMRMNYTQQAFGTLVEPEADGDVVYRQRSFPVEINYERDESDGLLAVTRDGNTQNKFWVGQKSLIVHECERSEPGSPNPAIRAKPLLDTVNLNPWNGRAARTVQFVDFSTETRDNGATYTCFYSFTEDVDGHDKTIAWTLPNGLLPDDIPALPNPGTALIQPKIIPSGDFSVLNIVIP